MGNQPFFEWWKDSKDVIVPIAAGGGLCLGLFNLFRDWLKDKTTLTVSPALAYISGTDIFSSSETIPPCAKDTSVFLCATIVNTSEHPVFVHELSLESTAFGTQRVHGWTAQTERPWPIKLERYERAILYAKGTGIRELMGQGPLAVVVKTTNNASARGTARVFEEIHREYQKLPKASFNSIPLKCVDWDKVELIKSIHAPLSAKSQADQVPKKEDPAGMS